MSSIRSKDSGRLRNSASETRDFATSDMVAMIPDGGLTRTPGLTCSDLARRELVKAYVITYISPVKRTTMTATEARANLFKLLDQVAENHEPVQITGPRHSGVLMSEEDFRAMQETVYLLAVPGMKESLLEGRKAPLRSYSRKRPW